MGKPGRAILCQPALNKIGVGREPSELKHLSRTRKRHQNEIPQVVASERGAGQTGGFILRGSDSHHDQKNLTERSGKAGHRG